MNIDQAEVNKFNDLADQWWDKSGQFKTLHDINPLRMSFIETHCELANSQTLDVGCGGGILSESLSLKGAMVTGIDLAEDSLKAAQTHADKNHIVVNYEKISAEEFAEKHSEQFDNVICMELLEHVPNPESLVNACAKLCKPGGNIFFSTINRTPKAYALTIVGAEYILKMLPKGTHDYKKFIKPSELESYCRAAGLQANEFKGIHYNPLNKRFSLVDDISMNYLLHTIKK
jgi:2-polyprenyl-6-hydroxyphenyl methylase/3-demethylubiquinone-9 3-methyltransferase